jgi:hypothetical protein
LTTKMLASTVQFSSYGRAQVRTEAPRAHLESVSFGEDLVRRASNPPVPSEEGLRGFLASEEASAPSGPNSVPGPTRPHRVRSCPRRGCTRNTMTCRRPTGQCSTP